MKKSLLFVLFALIGGNVSGSSILPNPAVYSVVVKTDLDISNGPAIGGDILVGRNYSGPGSPNGVIGKAIEDWNLIEQYSSRLGTLTNTGAAINKWGGLHFESSDPDVDLAIFSVDAENLTGVTWFTFPGIGSDTTVVVNVYGEHATFAGAGWQFGPVDPSRLVINFVDAKTVDLSSIAMFGTILAPKAAVTMKSGQLDATVLAKSLTLSSVGIGQNTRTGNSRLWDDIMVSSTSGGGPFETTAPEPSTLGLTALAMSFVAVRFWRRRAPAGPRG